MTIANEPKIDLDQIICQECGAAAKRIITSFYNPHPQHGESTALQHGPSAPNTLQIEFECDNGHIKFHTETFPRPHI